MEAGGSRVKALREKAGKRALQDKPVMRSVLQSYSSDKEDDEFLARLRVENRELEESLNFNFLTKSAKGMQSSFKHNTPQTSKEVPSLLTKSTNSKLTPLTAPSNAVLRARLKAAVQGIQTLEEKISEKDERIAELERMVAGAKKKSQVLVADGEKDKLKDKRMKEVKKECKDIEERVSEMKRKANRLEMVNGQLAEKIKSKIKDSEAAKAEAYKVSTKLQQNEIRKESLSNEFNE